MAVLIGRYPIGDMIRSVRPIAPLAPGISPSAGSRYAVLNCSPSRFAGSVMRPVSPLWPRSAIISNDTARTRMRSGLARSSRSAPAATPASNSASRSAADAA